MTSFRSIYGWMGAVALILVTSAGCGEEKSSVPTARLQGSVTLNGGPIPPDAQATISFTPIDSMKAVPASAEIKDGKFDAQDVPMGKVDMTITIQQATGKLLPDPQGRGDVAEINDLVPQAWRNGKEIQVDGDKSDLNYDLK